MERVFFSVENGHYSEKISLRLHQPFADHLEDLPIGLIGGVKSGCIDKYEFVSVFFMVQDSIC